MRGSDFLAAVFLAAGLVEDFFAVGLPTTLVTGLVLDLKVALGVVLAAVFLAVVDAGFADFLAAGFLALAFFAAALT